MNDIAVLILAGAAAFLVGGGVSVGNFLLSKKLIEGSEGVRGISIAAALRQVINIAFFIIVYFIASRASWPLYAILIGTAAGLTIPAFLMNILYSKKHK